MRLWTDADQELLPCRKSTLKSLGPYVTEHFLDAAYGVYPIEDDSKLAIVIVSSKYSPHNFW